VAFERDIRQPMPSLITDRDHWKSSTARLMRWTRSTATQSSRSTHRRHGGRLTSVDADGFSTYAPNTPIAPPRLCRIRACQDRRQRGIGATA
jgi:hypothetical protein